MMFSVGEEQLVANAKASYFVFRKLDVLEKAAAEISAQTGNKVIIMYMKNISIC